MTQGLTIVRNENENSSSVYIPRYFEKGEWKNGPFDGTEFTSYSKEMSSTLEQAYHAG